MSQLLAPASGGNYTAEVQAILTALHGVPVNTPLLIVSDCKSALQAAWLEVVPDGRRIRMGARSLMASIREILEIRRSRFNCPATRLHIHSHTSNTSTLARGNALADRLAGLHAGTPAPPALQGEERVVFWDTDSLDETGQPAHICEDLRAHLRAKAQQGLLDKLQAKGSQGEVARRRGPALLDLLRTLRGRGGSAHTFAFAALLRHLPTADRTFTGLDSWHSHTACNLCGMAQCAEYAFLCPFNRRAWQRHVPVLVFHGGRTSSYRTALAADP